MRGTWERGRGRAEAEGTWEGRGGRVEEGHGNLGWRCVRMLLTSPLPSLRYT